MKLSRIAAATVVFVGAGWSTMALAETLKVSSFLPPNHTFNRALKIWSDELEAKSSGALSLEVFPAGQLGPPPRQFDLVTSGAVDMAIILHSATPGRFPMTELAALPFAHPSAGDSSAIASRRLTELAPQYLAEDHAGTRVMWMAVTPPHKLHFRSVKPENTDSFAGLRIRYAGSVWQQVIEILGGAPVPVPPAESSDAMGKGVIDAAAFPYEATKSFDFAPVTKYSLEPGMLGSTFALVMSGTAYNRLSPELQKLIDETTGPDRAEAFGKMWDAGEAEGREYMVEGGVEIVTMSDEQLGIMRAKVEPIAGRAVESVKNGAEFQAAYIK